MSLREVATALSRRAFLDCFWHFGGPSEVTLAGLRGGFWRCRLHPSCHLLSWDALTSTSFYLDWLDWVQLKIDCSNRCPGFCLWAHSVCSYYSWSKGRQRRQQTKALSTGLCCHSHPESLLSPDAASAEQLVVSFDPYRCLPFSLSLD